MPAQPKRPESLATLFVELETLIQSTKRFKSAMLECEQLVYEGVYPNNIDVAAHVDAKLVESFETMIMAYETIQEMAPEAVSLVNDKRKAEKAEEINYDNRYIS